MESSPNLRATLPGRGADIHMCIFTYIYIHIYIHVYLYVYVYTYVCKYLDICSQGAGVPGDPTASLAGLRLESQSAQAAAQEAQAAYAEALVLGRSPAKAQTLRVQSIEIWGIYLEPRAPNVPLLRGLMVSITWHLGSLKG